MNGTCKCGGSIVERNHEVKTAHGIEGYGISCSLPAAIETSECKACGRSKVRIMDNSGDLVLDRG